MTRTQGNPNFRPTKREAVLEAWDAGARDYRAIAVRVGSTYGAVKAVLSRGGRTRYEPRPTELDAPSAVVYQLRVPVGLEIEAEERGVAPQHLAREVLKAVARAEAWVEVLEQGAKAVMPVVAEREVLSGRACRGQSRTTGSKSTCRREMM